MKRVLSIIVFICLLIGMLPVGAFAAEVTSTGSMTQISDRFKAIAAGGGHVVALKEDGTVIAWGDNSYGKCAIPSSLTKAKAIAAGGSHTVALKEDGTVIAWGNNEYGQCSVPTGLSEVKAIAAGDSHTVALKEDGTVIAWGDNQYEQCTIPSGLSNVKAIAAGGGHTAALKEDGTVITWGNNSFGQCSVPNGLSNVKAISVAGGCILALKEDGTVVAWGDDVSRKIPADLSPVKAIAAPNAALKEDGTIIVWGDNYQESLIPEGLTNVKTISVGGMGSIIALKEDGSLAAWGENDNGECILPTESSPVKYTASGAFYTVALREDGTLIAWGHDNYSRYNIPKGLSNVKAIAAADRHTIALKEDNTIVVWGDGSSELTPPTGLGTVKTIVTGNLHAVALKEDGTVFAWGNNYYGQINVPSRLSSVKAIAAGSEHSVALKEDGNVIAWGDNKYGQCNVPAGLTKVKAIAAGQNHSVALKENGTVVAWGDNDYGQCDVPNGLSSVKSISAGYSHTSALKEDGTVVAWGNSAFSLLNELTKIKSISDSVAVREDGTIIGVGQDFILFPKSTIPVNSISPYNAEFDPSGIGDITVQVCNKNCKLVNIKNGAASLTNNDYSISYNTILGNKLSDNKVTIKKSYLSYFFNKFDMPGVKLKLLFDFEDGNDSVLTVTRKGVSNFVGCNNSIFDSSNPQDITVNVTGAAIKAVKNGAASLNSNDCSISGSTVTIKKSYLSYFFNKFNAPWQKLNLVFDFENGNDPVFTISPMLISNRVTCDTAIFDPSNPKDINFNLTSNTLNAIKNGSASLNSNDYTISGNTVTIKKSYLLYFFNKFNAPWQKLSLLFDFEKGNDPLVSIVQVTHPSNTTNFVGMIKNFNKENHSVTLVRDINEVSTETEYSIRIDSDDLKSGSLTATTSPDIVDALITWDNFVINDMQGSSGDKTSITDPQHRVYKFYIVDNKITKIQRMNFGSNITPTKFNENVDSIDTFNARFYIDGTTFFDLKDNKVKYWRDIEGKSASKVVLQAHMKDNGIDADVVAFVNDTYKYIYDPITFYSYIKDEYFDGNYYHLSTITDDIKVNKDNIGNYKQIDKQFISYTKVGDESKIKTVTKAVYNAGYISPLVVQNDTTDSTGTVYTAYGTFDNKDGNIITVYAQGGTDSKGNPLTAGTMYSFRLDPQVKVTKLTFKDSGDIDTTSIQDATDIINGDKVGLVIIDGIVRMIYYKR